MGLKYNSIEQHVTPRPRSKRLREVSGGAVVTGQGTSSVEGGLGDGHTHANLKDLDKISFDADRYLYVTQYENDVLTKDKVKCGTADNLSPNSADWDKILLKATFDDLFEKVDIGTASNPIYVIRAKYSLYSDGGISAYGASNSQGGGGNSYDRLDKWADYGTDKAGYVLSALLGNDLNERLKTVESGSVLEFSIEGTGNAVTGVNKTGNKVVLTKGVMFALSSHTHSWSEIGARPSTLAGYGITDAKIANGVISLGSSSITPLTSHQSLAGYATENWVSSNFNKYVLPIASGAVAGGVMIGNGLNISSGVLSVGYGSAAGTACQGNDARLSDSRPASDVYAWAKQSAKPGYFWSEIGSKPTTLAGYGITDAKIANGVISLGSSSITPLTSHQSLAGYATENWVNSIIADMFEKVNLGTASNPIYVIRAKYSLYSDGGISAYGASNSQGGGGNSYDRLDKWADYGADKAGYVLSALLGNDLNERLKTVESGSALEFSVDGTGNAVTGINKTGSKVVLTKGAMFALSSHTHSWSEIGSKPTTLAGYGITDAASASKLAEYMPLAGGTIRGPVQIQNNLYVTGTMSTPNLYCESSFILSGDSMHEHGKFSDMYVELSDENNNGTNYLVFKYKGTSYKITIS